MERGTGGKVKLDRQKEKMRKIERQRDTKERKLRERYCRRLAHYTPPTVQSAWKILQKCTYV